MISYTTLGRKEIVVEPEPKRIKMSAARPMQVHNVPLEERAFDSKGNRLPWALKWPESVTRNEVILSTSTNRVYRGHPNARGQKRYTEEKGPFGKSNKRKGSSRTRTATPAKKENPTLDSFEKALSYDLKKQADSPTDTTTPSRSQNDTPSANKEPTQVLLYGYPSSRQWQAIDTYEKSCGGGIICEDYERQPDVSLRRYPNTISNAPRSHMTRPLTRAEKALAFQYAGGAHWVKVTFDSAGAAERAIENSPIQIQQHWVYAQSYYYGIAPQLDTPIAMTAEERAAGRPLTKHNQIYGPSSIQHTGALQGGPFSIPPNSTLNNSISNSEDQQQEDVSFTSSTASSGTATGPETSNLRHRGAAQGSHQVQAQQTKPQMMRFFPDTPRTILRPAHEALLPQPTFWERQFRWLADHGLMPGEVIGNGVPLLDNGQIDWPRASFYWKFFYWVDSTFGTDYCGLRNDD